MDNMKEYKRLQFLSNALGQEILCWKNPMSLRWQYYLITDRKFKSAQDNYIEFEGPEITEYVESETLVDRINLAQITKKIDDAYIDRVVTNEAELFIIKSTKQ